MMKETVRTEYRVVWPSILTEECWHDSGPLDSLVDAMAFKSGFDAFSLKDQTRIETRVVTVKETPWEVVND